MTQFVYTETVPAGKILSAALGVNASGKFVDADVGKPVKLAANNNYVLCADGNEIEGFVTSIEAATVNDGFSFGGVQITGRKLAQVVSGGAQVAVGDLVIAGTQIALGTAGLPQIKKGTAASQSGTTPFAYTERTPNTHIWRVIRIVTGTGVAGDQVLIERVST